MLLTEYNEKKYMRMFRKEAREEGLKEGRTLGLQEGLQQGLQQGQNRLLSTMLQNGASPEYLSKMTGLSLSEIETLPQTKNKKHVSSQKPSRKRKKRPARR